MGFILILNLILIAFVIIFVFKYILINFKLSDSRLRNTIIVILLCVSGFLSFYGASTSVYIGQTSSSIKYQLTQEIPKQVETEMKKELEQMKKDEKMSVTITVVGWGIFIITDIIQRKYLIKLAKKPGKGKWKLENYK